MYDKERWVLNMLLTIGTFIIIEEDFTEEGAKYKSRVIDAGQGYVMVDYPTEIKTGKTAYFMNGTQLYVSFTDKLKASYAFKTEVSGREVRGVPMLKITYPGDDQLIKIQRREFVRVETIIDVAVAKDEHKVQLVGEDISAGGIALNLPQSVSYNERDIVSLFIVLPFSSRETKYIQTEGEIVRVWEDKGRRIASIRFEGISVENRQHIVRFCFERQLQMRNE